MSIRFLVFCGFRRVIRVDEADLQHFEGPVLFISNHQSHFDYLITCLMVRKLYPRVLVAAGDNLAFFPMGLILRTTYAFFIARDFTKKGPSYSVRVRSYLVELFQKDVPIGFYIEGGRSRNGSLREAKSGFLGLCLQAAAQAKCPLIRIIPIGVAYDLPFEAPSLLLEQNKRKENAFVALHSFLNLFRHARVNAYIRFGQAIEIDPEAFALDPARIKDLATRARTAIAMEIPVTIGGFLHLALTENPRPGEDLYLEFSRFENQIPRSDFDNTLRILVRHGLLVQEEGVYKLTEKGKFELQYSAQSLLSKWNSLQVSAPLKSSI